VLEHGGGATQGQAVPGWLAGLHSSQVPVLSPRIITFDQALHLCGGRKCELNCGYLSWNQDDGIIHNRNASKRSRESGMELYGTGGRPGVVSKALASMGSNGRVPWRSQHGQSYGTGSSMKIRVRSPDSTHITRFRRTQPPGHRAEYSRDKKTRSLARPVKFLD
jgi:hypothetical protein